jgi:hypothetical protein
MSTHKKRKADDNEDNSDPPKRRCLTAAQRAKRYRASRKLKVQHYVRQIKDFEEMLAHTEAQLEDFRAQLAEANAFIDMMHPNRVPAVPEQRLPLFMDLVDSIKWKQKNFPPRERKMSKRKREAEEDYLAEKRARNRYAVAKYRSRKAKKQKEALQARDRRIRELEALLKHATEQLECMVPVIGQLENDLFTPVMWKTLNLHAVARVAQHPPWEQQRWEQEEEEALLLVVVPTTEQRHSFCALVVCSCTKGVWEAHTS